MSFLGRFAWWRRLTGGRWVEVPDACDFRDTWHWRRYRVETLEQKLVRVVGTADPEEIRRMLDEAKDGWRPPELKAGRKVWDAKTSELREPTAKELAASLTPSPAKRPMGKPWAGL